MWPLETPAQIAAARHLIGLTQQALAQEVGTTVQSVQNWEAGVSAPRPTYRKVIRELLTEHSEYTEWMVGRAELPEGVFLPTEDYRPRGWHIAAAARVLAVNPAAHISWMPEV